VFLVKLDDKGQAKRLMKSLEAWAALMKARERWAEVGQPRVLKEAQNEERMAGSCRTTRAGSIQQ